MSDLPDLEGDEAARSTRVLLMSMQRGLSGLAGRPSMLDRPPRQGTKPTCEGYKPRLHRHKGRPARREAPSAAIKVSLVSHWGHIRRGRVDVDVVVDGDGDGDGESPTQLREHRHNAREQLDRVLVPSPFERLP